MFVNSKWLNLHLSVCFRSASSFKLHCACNGAFVTYSTACHLCYHHLRHHRLRALLWQASRSMQVQWHKWVLFYLILCVCLFHMCVCVCFTCVCVCVFVSHVCACVCVCGYLLAVSFDVEFVWCWEGMGWDLFCCCCCVCFLYFIWLIIALQKTDERCCMMCRNIRGRRQPVWSRIRVWKWHLLWQGVGGTQLGHHQLWQLWPGHADSLPVYYHGGVDRRHVWCKWQRGSSVVAIVGGWTMSCVTGDDD